MVEAIESLECEKDLFTNRIKLDQLNVKKTYAQIRYG